MLREPFLPWNETLEIRVGSACSIIICIIELKTCKLMSQRVDSTVQWRVQMGARGARAIPSRLKKRGEKDVDLRPHTYVRTRGAKYRC